MYINKMYLKWTHIHTTNKCLRSNARYIRVLCCFLLTGGLRYSSRVTHKNSKLNGVDGGY